MENKINYVYKNLKDDQLLYNNIETIDLELLKEFISKADINRKYSEYITGEISLFNKEIKFNYNEVEFDLSLVIPGNIWDSENYSDNPCWRWEVSTNVVRTINKYFKSLCEDFNGRVLVY